MIDSTATAIPTTPGTEHRFVPSDGMVTDLVGRATAHPLGTTFLREGSLDAVAAIFQCHAFVVEAARQRLLDGEQHGA